MKKIKKYPLRFTAFLFFVIFCALSSFVYFTLGTGSVSSLIEQMLHREQVVARSGARSIRSLLLNSANTLNILTLNQDIISPNSKTQEVLNKAINNWRGTPLSLIALIDTQGNIVATASNQDSIKNTIAKATDRDYFESGLKLSPNDFFIGQPIIPELSGLKNEYLIPVSAPVYNQTKLVGIIVGTFYVSDLTSSYLNQLKISDQTDIILLDQYGYILSSNHSQVIGQSIFKYIEENPFLGDKMVMPILKDKIGINLEQKIDIAIPNLYTGKITRTLIATAPISINNNKWILAVTTPVEDALIFISPFILRNLLGIIISFFVSIAITLFLFNRFIKN